MIPLGNTDQTFADKQPVPKREVETPTCSKCSGELKTLSAMVSDCGRFHIRSVECLECKHSETLKAHRIGAPLDVRAIV